jgi:agmatine/peptidylarginine deiminase
MNRRTLALLLLAGSLLMAGGFFAGKCLQDYRAALDHRAAAARGSDVPVLPIPDVVMNGRIVGGFEHQAAMLLGVNELIQFDRDTLIEVVSALHDRLKLVGVVASDDQRADTIALLKAHNLPEYSIDFFRWPVEAIWVRDYAPFFMLGDHVTVIDFTYPEQNRDYEDNFPMALAATFGMHYNHCALTFEGGNLLSNGDRVCVTSLRFLTRNQARGYDADQIGALLHEHFGFDRWVRLHELEGEPTGHADMFVTFCAINKAIVGLLRADDDPANAQILDDNAGILKGQETQKGPLEVLRIPMPSHSDGNWRSYTNVIYANGVVLVPQYPDVDPALDKIALDVYREAMPGWKVVGIDCSKLIAKRGALHCISRNIPSLGGPGEATPTERAAN